MDEPLYLIHQADTIISISGQNTLSAFKQLLTPAVKLQQQTEFYNQKEMLFAAQQQKNKTVGAFLAQQQSLTFGMDSNDEDDDLTAQDIFSKGLIKFYFKF